MSRLTAHSLHIYLHEETLLIAFLCRKIREERARQLDDLRQRREEKGIFRHYADEEGESDHSSDDSDCNEHDGGANGDGVTILRYATEDEVHTVVVGGLDDTITTGEGELFDKDEGEDDDKHKDHTSNQQKANRGKKRMKEEKGTETTKSKKRRTSYNP